MTNRNPALSVLLTLLVVALPSLSWADTSLEDLVQAGDLINDTFKQGVLKKTDREWDLAISGSGFFPLQDSKSEATLYTRLGHFELDLSGYIVLAGHPTLRLIMQNGKQMGPVNLLKQIRQDGALMVGMTIGTDKGEDEYEVSGIYSSGEIAKVGRLVLAKVFNNGKLSAVSPHIFRAEAAALPSVIAEPSDKGLGRITKGVLEQL